MTGLTAPRFVLPAGWIGGLAGLIAVAAAFYLGLLLWSGAAQSLQSMGRIGGWTMVVGTAVASCAYIVRFARWHVILVWLGHRVAPAFNLRVYLAGLAATTSPGKLGEAIRGVLLLSRGVPFASSLAGFFADRLSDVAGVALIVIAAAALQGERAPVFELIAAAVILGGVIAAKLLQRHGEGLTRALGSRHAAAGRWMAAVAAPAQQWSILWSLRRASVCAAAAFFAYGLQSLVFAAYVRQLDSSISLELGVQVFASATLIGAASMIPAGLGAMEAAAVYQLIDAGMSPPHAVAAAVAHRLSTLWFGMVIGVGCLLSMVRLRAASSVPGPAAEE